MTSENFRKTKKNTNKQESRLKYSPSQSSMPKLSFKSSLLVISVTFIILFMVPFLLELVPPLMQWLTLMISAGIVGMTIAYAHCFIETKRGIGSVFWRLSVIIAVLVFILEFFLFGLGIYL